MKKAALLLACFAAAAEAADYAGLSLEQALERLRAQGVALFYSSDLVGPEMRVAVEPRASEPRAILEEILAPHGLAIEPARGGGLLLVRAESVRVTQPPIRPLLTPLAEVVVSASHYELGSGRPAEPTVLTAADLEAMPDMGDDPIRAVSRLPGVARADFSSRTNIRGGSTAETLVLFDDLRLYNPYHFKDFFGLFSTIDPGIVGDVSVYTGGFPVNYGDRSSGVIAISPELPSERFGGKALLSLFSAGASAGGTFDGGDGEWMASIRRGNMDLIFDIANEEEIGEPDYHDLHARVGRRIGESLSLSASYLAFDDTLTAADSDQEEQAQASYRDEYAWLRLDAGDAEGNGGRVIASHTRLASDRSGTMDLPGIATGSLSDRRRFSIDAVQADAWGRPRERLLLQAGAEWRGLRGHYRYQDQADFELLFDTTGAPTKESRVSSIELRPRGNQQGAYANLRIWPFAGITTDLGLRWDRETLSAADESDVSPRAVLLWEPRRNTRLRFSWGRYAQAQGIDELPVSDGQTGYAPPQHATHWVLSWEQQLMPELALRLEAYRKKYQDLQPRYENLLNTLIVLPELKPDRIRIAPDSAEATGVEASLHWNARPWNGWLSYSRARVEDRIDGLDVARSWDQRNALSTGLSYVGPLWEFSLTATWHSGWPTTEIELETLDPEAVVAVGPVNGISLKQYARIDARAARRFYLEDGGELTLFLEVSNLLSRHNDCCVEYQLEDEEIPGEVFLDVAAVQSLPLVPSIGVVWRF